MKNRKITLACVVALGVLAVTSCNKKTDDSVHARLVGKWKTALVGFDANGNGVIDATESQFVPNALYFTFSGDGSGKVQDSASANIVSTSWTLKNNDADLVLKNTSGSTTDSPVTYHIAKLTSSDLNFSYGDSTILEMKKQ